MKDHIVNYSDPNQNTPVTVNPTYEGTNPCRYNRDRKVSTFGRLLIETCVVFNLIILNGRTSGDLSGQYTCFKYNGQSTIDYAIVNEDIFTHVKFFTVSPPSFSSCHSPISFALRLNNMRTHEKVENLHTLPVSLKWNSIVRDKFQQVIRSRDFETKLQNLSKPLSQDNINDNNTNENFVSNFTLQKQ